MVKCLKVQTCIDGVIIWKCAGGIEKEINNFQQVIFPTSSALVSQMGKITVSSFSVILHKLSQNHKKNEMI